MLYSEFVERTNYEPSMEEYHLIETLYYVFPDDKNAFCKWYMEQKNETKQYLLHFASEYQTVESEKYANEKQFNSVNDKYAEKCVECEDLREALLKADNRILSLERKLEQNGLLEKLEWMDRQTGALYTHRQAIKIAIEEYDYMDDTNCITFEELFEKVSA